MSQALLAALAQFGWQAAGWLTAAGLSALIYFGAPLLRARAQQDEVKAKAAGHESAWYWLETGAEKAVSAAQQWLDDNPAKKAYAVQFLQDFLDSRGIHFPFSVVSGAVEAAVATLRVKQGQALLADPTPGLAASGH